MSQTTTSRARRRGGMRTWSELGDLGRKPTRYEILTHGMNHTAGGRGLELGPDVHGNVWLREHRDTIDLQVPDWEAFRDPDELTYDRYVAIQDAAETYLDGVIARFADADGAAAPRALGLLARCVAPTRYLSHAQQMLSAYVQQLAPSAYVANCASFQAADQLRRTQRIAERTQMLQLAHPDRGFGEAERAIWETDASWQLIRRACERALVVYEWDRALVATNLVVKPICDQLFLAELAVELRAAGDDIDALIAENLHLDALRSQRWTAALARYVGEADAGNAAVLGRHLASWAQDADAVLRGGAALLASGGGRSPSDIQQSAAAAWHELLEACGLRI